MDVILDANAYIGVLFARGNSFLQTNRFAELFAYLRRTNSRLVVPLLVYSEVVERYRDKLSAIAREAARSWEALQSISITARPDFPEPSIPTEISALRKLLRLPAPGIPSLIYGAYSSVSIHEVARRGVKRIPPASEDGEELRDVILWLAAFHYVRQSGRATALISNDKAFRLKDDDALRANLQSEITESNLPITFYPSIGDFVKANALERVAVGWDWLSTFVTNEELNEIVQKEFLSRRIGSGEIFETEILEANASEVSRYLVGENSFYVEAQWVGKARVKTRQTRYVVNQESGVTPGVSFIPNTATSVFVSGFGPLSTAQPANLSTGMVWNNPPVFGGVEYGRGIYGSGVYGGGVFGGGIYPSMTAQSVEFSYECSFELSVSLRIANEIRESFEPGRFTIGDAKSIDRPEKPE